MVSEEFLEQAISLCYRPPFCAAVDTCWCGLCGCFFAGAVAAVRRHCCGQPSRKTRSKGVVHVYPPPSSRVLLARTRSCQVGRNLRDGGRRGGGASRQTTTSTVADLNGRGQVAIVPLLRRAATTHKTNAAAPLLRPGKTPPNDHLWPCPVPYCCCCCCCSEYTYVYHMVPLAKRIYSSTYSSPPFFF